MRELEQRVYDRIRLLDGNRISGASLGSAFGVSDIQIRATVKSLRLGGYPIAGIDSDGGYWLAKTPEELLPTIEKFKSLIASHSAIITALEQTRRDLSPVREGELF